MSDGFAYREGRLHADAVALEAIAAEVGTPTYVYSASVMRARLAELEAAFAGLPVRFFYALKANGNVAVVRTLLHAGAGAEIVSGGELARALAAGASGEQIVFAGVGKTRAEMRAALAVGILQFNVESVPELRALDAVARDIGVRAPVALRINPDVAAATHDKISTGRATDKFGIPAAEAKTVYALARDLPGIAIVGLHIHVGSQIVDPAGLVAAYGRAVDLCRDLLRAGLPLRRLDLGGGFGVAYEGDARLDLGTLAERVRALTRDLDLELAFEPGRFLVADAGVLLARLLYVKNSGERRFLVLDAGMNDLVRPAMYDAHHDLIPVAAPVAGAPRRPVDVVGPICESADVFARDRSLPALEEGALVALTHAGAYGAVMASTYNARPLPAEVLVDGHRWAVVRPRRTVADLIAEEALPDWLDQATPARRTTP